MFDSNSSRHRCRNPRCKAQLREPVANPRDAFCCASCEAGYYRTHCRVCEKEFGDVKRNSRRELCGRRQCRNQFRSFRTLFFSVWYPNAIRASKPEKSSTRLTLKTGIKSDRLWIVAGPELSPSTFRCAGVGCAKAIEANNRATAQHWRGHCRLKPSELPGPLGAPVIDLAPGPSKSEPKAQPHDPQFQAKLDAYRAQISDDLSIPAFLRRRPS
jgi:hypothetical protein